LPPPSDAAKKLRTFLSREIQHAVPSTSRVLSDNVLYKSTHSLIGGLHDTIVGAMVGATGITSAYASQLSARLSDGTARRPVAPTVARPCTRVNHRRDRSLRVHIAIVHSCLVAQRASQFTIAADFSVFFLRQRTNPLTPIPRPPLPLEVVSK